MGAGDARALSLRENMKKISKFQLISLWLCVVFLGFSFLRIAARAAWGFLRLASEYKEEMVPRDVLFSLAEGASNDFWHFTILIGISFLFLLFNVIWLTISNAKMSQITR